MEGRAIASSRELTPTGVFTAFQSLTSVFGTLSARASHWTVCLWSHCCVPIRRLKQGWRQSEQHGQRHGRSGWRNSSGSKKRYVCGVRGQVAHLLSYRLLQDLGSRVNLCFAEAFVCAELVLLRLWITGKKMTEIWDCDNDFVSVKLV